MRSMLSSHAIALLCVFALALAGCGDKAPGGGGGGGGEASGAESPEALVEKARGYAEKEDFAGIVNLMVPDERPLMSFGMMMFAKMAPMFVGGMGALGEGLGGEDAKKEIDEKMAGFEKAMKDVLDKYGLGDVDMDKPPPAAMGNDPKALAKWMNDQAPDLDHGAFVAEMIEAFSSLGEETAGKATGNFKDLGGELKDLKIDGDTATGTIGEDSMTFKKVDGRWYFSVADKMGG
ncbi:MAG: hypothetical protein QNJ98_08735 [Planctomycetota bacterium]|nr:hypothetical protein [Planctomycetota bacterium]